MSEKLGKCKLQYIATLTLNSVLIIFFMQTRSNTNWMHRRFWAVSVRTTPSSSLLLSECSNHNRLHAKFRVLCRSFFMEVISTLCFERNMPSLPEHDLIMMLMDIVFAEGKSTTRVLSPFNNEKADPGPVIRSYLLQLLLTFR